MPSNVRPLKVIAMEARTLKRPFVIAALCLGFVACALAGEASQTTSQRRGNVWSYVVVNNTANPISIVTLSVRGPVRVIGRPKGWKVQTDGCSTVSWLSKVKDRDIAPNGGKLGGFAVRSDVRGEARRELTLVQWDVEHKKMGPSSAIAVAAPDNSAQTCAQD